MKAKIETCAACGEYTPNPPKREAVPLGCGLCTKNRRNWAIDKGLAEREAVCQE